MRAQGGAQTSVQTLGRGSRLLLLMMMWLLLRMGLLLLLQRVRILKVVGTRCTTMDQNLLPTQLGTSNSAESSESRRFHARVHLDV
jgi:hypothetical protein